MNSGLLSETMTRERVESFDANDWRLRTQAFQEPTLTKNLQLVDLLKQIGSRHGRSNGEGGNCTDTSNPAVANAIVGRRNAKQVGSFVNVMHFRLSPQEINEIEVGLPEPRLIKVQDYFYPATSRRFRGASGLFFIRRVHPLDLQWNPLCDAARADR